MYGFQDSKEVVQGAGGGRFGLNQKATVSVFQYNPNGGKDGAAQDCIDFTVKIGEREFRTRFFPVDKIFVDNVEVTDKTSQVYKDEAEKAGKLISATLTEIVKAFVPEDQVKEALSVPFSGFAQWAQAMERLVKSVPNWDSKLVDVFLQYQWQITGENTQTFLELPRNVKQGLFICAHIPATFTEDRTDTHLRYINDTDGSAHPFKRSAWFVESDFANQQKLDDTTGAAGNAMNAGTSSSAGW